jgi:chaperonin GroES
MAVRNLPVLIELRDPTDTFLPSHDYHLIQASEAPHTTPGGIVLPDGAEVGLGSFGTVIASGPGNITLAGSKVPMDHGVGDVVITHPQAIRFQVLIGGVKFIAVRDSDCIGKVVKKETGPAIEYDYRGFVPVSAADFLKAVSLKNGQMPDGNFVVTSFSGAPLCFSDEGLQDCIAKVREYQSTLPQSADE